MAEGLKEVTIDSNARLEMIFNDGGNNKIIAEYIQESLEQNLGVKLNLQAMTFQERVNFRMNQKDFDFCVSRMVSETLKILSLTLTCSYSMEETTTWSYSNPRYDELVRLVKSTGDHVVRTKAMVELEGIIAEDTPVVVLMHREA